MSRENPPWGSFVQSLRDVRNIQNVQDIKNGLLLNIYRDNNQEDPLKRVRVYEVVADEKEELLKWGDMDRSLQLVVSLLAGVSLQYMDALAARH